MVKYWERKYYDDPEENERFIRIYGPKLYCKHGNPNYTGCPFCKHENKEKIAKQYQKKRPNVNFTFFNEDDISFTTEDKFKSLENCKSKKQLKKIYYQLCLKFHPDKGGDEEDFKQLTKVYHKLRSRL